VLEEASGALIADAAIVREPFEEISHEATCLHSRG
jgi:hypothetical protein